MSFCEKIGVGALRLAPGDGWRDRADPRPARDAAGRHRLAAAGADRAAAGGVIAYTENMADTDALPDDVPTLNAMIARQQAEIAHLQLWIAKLRRQRFGRRSERTGKRLGQLELHLEELETGAAELDARTEPVTVRCLEFCKSQTTRSGPR